MRYKAFFDGSSKPNPGLMQIGHLIKDENNNVLYSRNEIIGEGTNNIAEYTSLLFLLRKIQEYNLENVTIFGDSQLVVKQIEGSYKIKNEKLIPIYKQIKEIMKNLKGCEIKHILRENNKEADRLTR